MVVEHRQGVKHGNADALFRLAGELTPCREYIAGINPECLQCGGCEFCESADKQWVNLRGMSMRRSHLLLCRACSVEMGGQEDHASREGI